MNRTLFLAFAVVMMSLPSMAQDPEKRVAERTAEVQALVVHNSAITPPKVSEVECSDALRLWNGKEKQDSKEKRDSWYEHLTVLEVLRLQAQARACNQKRAFAQREEFDYWIKQFDLVIENALWGVIIENSLVALTHGRPVTQ